MTSPENGPTGTEQGDAGKQHGDPLLDTAQGRGDGTDASRHGADADGTIPADPS